MNTHVAFFESICAPSASPFLIPKRSWGEFNESTRTISISRKLVNEYPWHVVVGVFRHEMAHQLVSEDRSQSDRPHSEAFKAACRRLGVPSQYARAGLDLKESHLDWRTEPRDAAAEKILDKVKKLLALANSANEHEALLAMERVREIYAKYNLEHTARAGEENFVHLVLTNGKKRMESWQQRIVAILTDHFFVKVLMFRQFEAKSQEHHHALEIIGTRENVLMAEYVYYFLINQLEALIKDAGKNGIKLERSDRTSYRLGVLDGFDDKLELAKKAAAKSGEPAQSSSTALSVVGRALEKFHEDPALEDYLGEIYPRLRSRQSSSINVKSEAFAAGHSAGKAINLNRPITHETGNAGRLLPGGGKR